ncbi:MAG TPA: L,D-transpeptidase family protein [Vicinamibacterales bacterium]|nr:L,D-transpeptidase family protein [Vicinamibacterales bacterium]
MARILALVLGGLCAVSCADHRASVTAALNQRLVADARHAALTKSICGAATDAACEKRAAEVWKDLNAFYGARSGSPVWVNGKKPGYAATIALSSLQRAAEHGLDPERYGASTLKAELARLTQAGGKQDESAGDLAKFESEVTSALLALGRDVAVGQPGAPPAGTGDRRREPPEIATRLAAVVDEGDIATWPDEVRPTHPQYAALQAALLKPAAPDARNVIALNLERWRWMPDDLGEKYVLVNVPSFHVWIMEHGAPVLDSKAIVGRLGDETPLFSATMTTVVFSPYWNIPESIAAGETVPSILKNPAYLAKNGIEVLRRTSGGVERVDPASVDWSSESETSDLSLRQRPGPGNALGHIKFLLPNRHNVYLHDTPSHKLFDKNGRALSHGCVRIDEPVKLARYFLADEPEWTEEAITKAMHSGQERGVKLRQPVPVHIVYFTAWAEPDGSVALLKDVYGRDRR